MGKFILGLIVGVFEPGAQNAITDVAGVRVGHSTVVEPPNVRTGVTAIVPHGGNAYLSRVPAAMHVGNGYGKLSSAYDYRRTNRGGQGITNIETSARIRELTTAADVEYLQAPLRGNPHAATEVRATCLATAANGGCDLTSQTGPSGLPVYSAVLRACEALLELAELLVGLLQL